jgi:hypothetical protein
MAHHQQTRPAPRRSPPASARLRTGAGSVTGWFGWLLFVGILLVGAGLINAVQGLVALFDDDFYLATPSDLAIDIDYTAWGWALLILGVTLIAAGCGVAFGFAWARVVGVVVASFNALVNLGFVAAYPMWTVLAVSFDVLTIYALVVHGGEGTALRNRRS